MTAIPTSRDGKWHYLIAYTLASEPRGGSTGYIVDDPINAPDIPTIVSLLSESEAGQEHVVITTINLLSGPARQCQQPPGGLDLAAVRERHDAFELAWDHEYMSPEGPTAAAASAGDVPTLVAEVEQLRARLGQDTPPAE